MQSRDLAMLPGPLAIWLGEWVAGPAVDIGAKDVAQWPFPPLVEIRENPEFHDLMRMEKGHWPRCLFWHGWLPVLSGVDGASPWAASASERASYLDEAALGGYSSRLVTEWSPPDEFDRVEVLHLWSLITPMSGLMVALSLIRSLVFLHLELGSLLTSLRTTGVIGGGVMLIMFALRVKFSPVEVSVLFLGLSSLFRGLKCGVSFWLCSLLERYTCVLTILVSFVM